MKNTLWQPTGEAVEKVKSELSKAIRTNLPAINKLNQPGWAFGTTTVMHATTETPEPRVQLKTLSWRQIDTIDWQRRACARGVFSGQARLQGRIIDFTGDNMRDFATGAFLEFQLLTMGL